MKTYPSYEILAIDLDLHFFDKLSILRQIGNRLIDGSWFVVTDDGQCHLFDENGNLDDIRKLHALHEDYINKSIKKIIIPDSVTSIENYVFEFCSELRSATIPNTVTNIGWFVFHNCSRLMRVIIPDSVTSIGWYAFFGCSGLTRVTIGNNITSIGDCAFSDCNSLANTTIPKSIKYIGYNAFYNCKNLKNLFFKGKTLEQVKTMVDYPWGIENENIIKAEFE